MLDVPRNFQVKLKTVWFDQSMVVAVQKDYASHEKGRWIDVAKNRANPI